MNRSVILFPSYPYVSHYKSHTQFHDGVQLGVEATTLGLWLEDRWDLYGSEERLITSDQRLLLVKHLLNNQDCLPKGHNTARLIARFFQEVWGHPNLKACLRESAQDDFLGEDQYEFLANLQSQLSDQERALFDLARDYQKCLYRYNLIEPGDAYSALATTMLPEHLETLDFLDLPPAFVVCCQKSQSTLISHEPDLVAVSLDASVKPCLLYASGPSALPYLVGLRALSLLEGEDNKTAKSSGNSVLVAAQNPQRYFDGCARMLVREGYTVASRWTKRFDQTDFGHAFFGAYSLWADDELSVSAVSDYLLTPYSGFSRSQAYKLSAQMRGDRLMAPDQVRNYVRSINDNYGYFEELFESSDASIVLGYFEDIVNTLSDVDPAYKSEQRQAIHALRSLYDAARRLSLSPAEFLDMLGSVVVAVSVATGPEKRDYSTSDVDIFIASYSYARDLALEGVNHVIACDLDDQSFPARGDHSALVTLKRKLAIPLVEETLNEQRLTFAALQQGSHKTFDCAVALANDKGEESYPAFFFDEFLSAYRQDGEDEHGFDVPAQLQDCVITHGEETFAQNISQGFDAETRETDEFVPGSVVLNNATLTPKQLSSLLRYDEGGAAIVSPSAIEEYLKCPYRWFVSRKLSPEGLDEGFGPLEQGSFCHDVFARFYDTLRESGQERVSSTNLDSAKELLADVFDTVLEEQPAKTKTQQRYVPVYRYEQFSVQQLKNQLLASLEQQSVLFDGFKPYACELTLTPEMHIQYAGIVVNGRVDRVDINDAAHHYLVLDYKGSIAGHSAGYNPDDEFVIPSKVQTLIYAQALRQVYSEHRPVGALYLSYKAAPSQRAVAGSYDPSALCLDNQAGKKDVVSMNFITYLDQIEDALKTPLDRMQDGCIEMAPHDTFACRYCPAVYCPRRQS